jgi:hypothetical protein
VFHRFRQAKFDYGGLVLSLSQYLLLPQLPQKVELTSKVVKVDSKVIVSLPEIQIRETHCNKQFDESVNRYVVFSII